MSSEKASPSDLEVGMMFQYLFVYNLHLLPLTGTLLLWGYFPFHLLIFGNGAFKGGGCPHIKKTHSIKSSSGDLPGGTVVKIVCF